MENRLTDFSLEKWDKNEIIDSENCLGYRKSIYKSIIDQQEKLIGMGEVEVTSLFGNPEQVHISKRMRKSVFYCINGCSDCSTPEDQKKYLVVDFETLRRVKTIRTSFATE